MINEKHFGSEVSPDFERTPVILVADDDPSIRLLLRHVMEQCGYHVIEASNGIEAIQFTIKQLPDLILMDAVMPELDGFRATEEIRKMPECESITVLMATSLDDDKSIARAFEVGACDYVTKPFNWSVLKHRVTRMLFAADAERKIRHIAYHDSLTGLPNRMLFMDRIDQAISRAEREQGQFALLYIDIDHFKVINDSMGHAAGDQLLNTVSERLRHVLRKSDTVARLGGDEFTVIIEGLQEAEWVITVANNILETLLEPVKINSQEVHISGSIGIALYPQDGENFGTLLKHADTAMYKAKDKGRHTFQFYASEMSLKAVHRLELESQIRTALKEEQFVVYYQPKISLTTDKYIGVEALVRWQHPEKGMIPPIEFIPLAEETGLITQLDEWVMRTACEQFNKWKKAGSILENLSVNVSARHFKKGGLSVFCRSVLEKSSLDPSSLEIELTESALVDNYSSAKKALEEIHEMGIQIALDDFGTGYASMSYLKEFPFDTVKLDRSFIKGIPDDMESTAIVDAMIQLSSALSLNVVAEGVETEQQKAYLADKGCFYAQGYLWARPVSADELEKMIF
ncbi:Sensory box/GGDEF family protein [hydrothermal vent metagenome]|uniref:Sensory box/GGDEF family protein n=1 Tax=hydrothermal vent metagenome TaxID=652676 RepID=A0A3B0YAZ7_9ZZZZ